MSTLSARFLTITLSWVVITLILLLSGFELYRYQKHYDQFIDKITIILESYSQILTQTIQQHDAAHLTVIAQTLLLEAEITGVWILAPEGQVLEYLGHVQRPGQRFQHAIYSSQHHQPIAILEVFASYEPLQRLFWHYLMLDGLLFLAVILTTSGAILAAHRKLIAPPSRFLQQLFNNNLNPKTVIPWNSEDEIGQLIQAYNELLVQVQHHEIEFNQLNQSIEQYSKEKTQLFLALRKSEARLEQFLEAMPVGVLVIDSASHPYYANHKAQQLFGATLLESNLKPTQTAIYQVYQQQKPYPRAQHPIVQALTGKTTQVSDMELHCLDKVIPLEMWATPIFDEHDNISYVIAAFEDISERKQAEQERLQHNQDLDELNMILTQLNEAYERFVPHELLSFLNKENVVEVNLGDQVEQEMSILFSDIRGFTTLSEKMSPQDNFEFLNAYLGEMEPVIAQHDGFIDKYIGDAIMALFPNTADNAVQGGIAMLKTLERYNYILQEVGFQYIRIGIGINTGRLMLGTIGSPNRMDGTVISDAVNLASRVEGLTKLYGTALLITEYTYQQLTAVARYNIRMIDSVTVKGKTKAVTIYEVFDADSEENIALKLDTLMDFEQGVHCYHQQALAQARRFFEQVLAINPHDGVAQVYWQRCQ
ncbi:MAG: adenylate/guanylate cyclase domain-containing protein [Pseudomonadota bacterium]|nr:adenylate/guanylate cyclase domain-containing protein [Pseudomonadota bacterium]